MSAVVASAVSPALSSTSVAALISPVPTVVVMPPFSVTSTRSPPLARSSWLTAVPVVAVVPSAATRFTLRLTASTVTASASVTKIEPVVVFALSTPTAVSRWLLLAPIAAPAVTSSLAAVTSTALVSTARSSTLPEASNATLPVPAAISPIVTSPFSACTRTAPPALVITEPSTIAIPASACTSTVPPAVVTSAVASFSLTPSFEMTLM